ncbi:hemagglutinin repeat-containing protein [Neisseria maigaei]|uniref:hemagglutinin repeat-containing protein n=1 Tax=Neisseria maigaei TaxID=2830651 RepID=UPI002657BAA3|nr:hemagglutinin repeat-containing protein [Neisseria maigaei]
MSFAFGHAGFQPAARFRFGSDCARSRSTQVQDGSSAEAVGSSLTAGHHLSIRATEGNIEAKGAQISAEGDALKHHPLPDWTLTEE